MGSNIPDLLEAEKVLCSIVLENKERVAFFLHMHNYFVFKEIFFQNFQELCRNMWVSVIYPNGDYQEIQNKITYEYVIYIYAGQMLSVLELWAKRGFKESPEDFVSIYEQTFTASPEFKP